MKDLTIKELDALKAIRESDALVINAADAAAVMSMDPQTLRSAAKAGTLSFPVDVYGSKVLIPRIPFLNHFGIY